MPSGISLLKLLKRNPPTDTRNLIEPTSDIRYLGMKERAIQAKNIFEFLNTTDVPVWWIDNKGRFIMTKFPAVDDEFTVTFLRTPTGSGEGGTWLQDVLDLVADSSHITMKLPAGEWSITAPLDLTTHKKMSITGSGFRKTILSYVPPSPTVTPFINFPKAYNKLKNLSLSGGANLTGALVRFSGYNNMVEDCLVGCAQGDALSFMLDFNTIRGCWIRAGKRGITITGQASTYRIENNLFDGQGSTPDVAIYKYDNTHFFNGIISGNVFRNFDYGIRCPDTMGIGGDMIICNNVMESTISTKFIDEPQASVYLINGNVFNGSATFTISANAKARANIGLADQN